MFERRNGSKWWENGSVWSDIYMLMLAGLAFHENSFDRIIIDKFIFRLINFNRKIQFRNRIVYIINWQIKKYIRETWHKIFIIHRQIKGR